MGGSWLVRGWSWALFCCLYVTVTQALLIPAHHWLQHASVLWPLVVNKAYWANSHSSTGTFHHLTEIAQFLLVPSPSSSQSPHGGENLTVYLSHPMRYYKRWLNKEACGFHACFTTHSEWQLSMPSYSPGFSPRPKRKFQLILQDVVQMLLPLLRSPGFPWVCLSSLFSAFSWDL